MLPISQRVAFLILTAVTGLIGARGFHRVFLRIRRGSPDGEARVDHPWRRLWYAVKTSLTQARTFRKRPLVTLFHSFIVYGFFFYILVNFIDALEGYLDFSIRSSNPAGAVYNLCADILSFLVLLGVIALVVRRYVQPGRRDFDFNPTTPLHEKLRQGYIARDSAIVSAFILFHVGSRVTGEAAKLKLLGGDRFQPFATLLSRLVPRMHAQGLEQFGYWGALGSVLLFLAYFPWSKHIHLLLAPLKYFFAREANSGELPLLEVDVGASDAGSEPEQLGARSLEDLAWPRLLDAYACIQCNRCQDVCPATATGKALSPAALEINKRMELNVLGEAGGLLMKAAPFEQGSPSPRPLLEFALSPEALWACTTCGACMEVCPVENEQMLDIIDIRRNQVMMEGKFPSQLQTVFRGMERTSNPWGISRDHRLDWAEGLPVATVENNPDPDVLFWVGCAASYDPQAQRTARAFVQLLNHAKVNFAVLGKRECCTGDSARRAGNEYLYTQLAEQNITTLNAMKPKLIVATCPHCMNSIGNEYRQLGGRYQVMHHTEYLDRLVAEGRLTPEPIQGVEGTITYHDPCYLGRHNGVYEAPRNVLRVLTNEFVELERNRENSFCCGAGGAQFWKEEEPGRQRISDNRFQEVKQRLGSGAGSKVLAVGCPFCKSMLSSTPGKSEGAQIEVKDVAELLLESVRQGSSEGAERTSERAGERAGERLGASPPPLTVHPLADETAPAAIKQAETAQELLKIEAPQPEAVPAAGLASEAAAQPERKKWQPAKAGSPEKASMAPKPEEPKPEESKPAGIPGTPSSEVSSEVSREVSTTPSPRKPWKPKGS